MEQNSSARTLTFIIGAVAVLALIAILLGGQLTSCSGSASVEPTLEPAPTGAAITQEPATSVQESPTATLTQEPSPTPLPASALVLQTPEGVSNLYIEYIMDASGSMLETLDDGVVKQVAAKDYLIDHLLTFKPETHLGLRAYGHNVRWEDDEDASCRDIELIAPVDTGQIINIVDWLDQFETLGMTPIHAAVEQALEDFDTSDPDRLNNILLISDGIETCGGDPCELVDLAKRSGINFSIYVVGIAVDEETRQQLSCIADKGGGIYYDVNDSEDFERVLSNIQSEVEADEVVIPFSTATAMAWTSTFTPEPTDTQTPIPATNTPTPVPPTPTPTRVPPTRTPTRIPATATPTLPPATPTPTVSACVPPTIVDFYAAPPPRGSTARFTLHYSVQGATRVEIFGNVLNPASGAFDVWDDVTNYWVLWASAGDSSCYIEEAIEVDPDSITPPGPGLQDVDVDRRDITISVRDHSAIDGDRIDLIVNGVTVLSNYTLTSSAHGVPVTLNSGQNRVEVLALNEGSSSPNTVEVSVSNVVRGSAVQVSAGMQTGEREAFTIVAP